MTGPISLNPAGRSPLGPRSYTNYKLDTITVSIHNSQPKDLINRIKILHSTGWQQLQIESYPIAQVYMVGETGTMLSIDIAGHTIDCVPSGGWHYRKERYSCFCRTQSKVTRRPSECSEIPNQSAKRINLIFNPNSKC